MSEKHAEIHLLGTGGGYGESVVAHLGNGDWIVVDSCKEPYGGAILPLDFLKEKEVDLGQVKLIVCTHWHDDHIKGLSILLEQCPNAKFSFAKANDLEKFGLLLELDHAKLKGASANSSTLEFKKCMDVMVARFGPITFSGPDRMLYSETHEEITCQVHSLSPSDKSNIIFDQEITNLISEYGPSNKKIPKQEANDRSVVLVLSLGSHTILLGADLEIGKDGDASLGWLDIINNSVVIGSFPKSTYFKISHHGSENGYHDDIWSKLLADSPVAALTPWNLGGKLPQSDMVEKYIEKASELHITSAIHVSGKPKKRTGAAAKAIRDFGIELRELKFQYGVVSAIIDITDPEATWLVEPRGEAKQLG